MSIAIERAPGSLVETTCCLCGPVSAPLIRAEKWRTIVRCPGCGFVFCANITYDDLQNLYEDEYWGGESEVGYSEYLVHPEVHAQWNRTKMSGVAKAGIKPPGRLLDVGCATGDWVKAAGEAGFQASGIEISHYAGNIARERGLDVHVGTLLDAPYGDGEFDVITMWDVIEHVPDPVLEARKLLSLLKPGGAVVMATPNVGSLRARREGANWHGFRVSQEHVLFFTPDTLGKVLRKAGFVNYRSDTYMIDERIRVLLNPWADCSNLPVNIRGHRFYHIWEPNPMTVMHSILEQMGFGHVLLGWAYKPKS
jgi:2-polyprenyl-3-methyl-5-hydroxy-6-metoxy-1,4-benzoquinol methylase